MNEPDGERIARYAKRSFLLRKQVEFPTVREAARTLGWTQQRVIEAVEEAIGAGLTVDLAVGIQIGGGGGYGVYDTPGDYQIEWYGAVR